MTLYKKFRSEIVEKKSEKEGKVQHFYQDVKLKKFQNSNTNVRKNYIEAICNIADCIEECFSLFLFMVTMLDVSTWLPVSSAEKFSDQEIIEITHYFKKLFSTGLTQVDKILIEWVVLKSYMLLIMSNNDKLSYLDIWKIVFTNATIVKECRNVLDIFKLFLICPFTNAKLERMFSHMNCIKNDWRSILSRDRLDVLLC